jgi:hypothetical protein
MVCVCELPRLCKQEAEAAVNMFVECSGTVAPVIIVSYEVGVADRGRGGGFVGLIAAYANVWMLLLSVASTLFCSSTLPWYGRCSVHAFRCALALL